jgi:diguanylate cyclase (GGDEF)-like protein
MHKSIFAAMPRPTVLGMLRWGQPAFGVLIMATMWFLGWTYLQQDQQRTEAEAYRRSEASTQAYESYILRSLQQIDQLAEFVAGNAQLTRSDDSLTTLLQQALRHQPSLGSLYVTNEAGDVVAAALSKGKVTAAGSAADRLYFQVHKERRVQGLYVGQPAIGRVSRRWVIHLSRARFHADGSFAGVVVATVNPEYLVDFYNEAQFGQRGLVSVTGIDQVLRARRSGAALQFGDHGGQTALARQIEKAPKGGFLAQSRVDGVSRFISYRVVPQYQLVVYTGLAYDEVFAQHQIRSERLIESLSVATLFICLATAGLTWLVIRLDQSRRRASLAEDRFQAAAHAQLDPFMMLAAIRLADGSLSGFRCDLANPRAQQWMGRKPGSLVGQVMEPLVPAVLRPHLGRLYAQALSTRTAMEDEFSWQAPHGDVRRVVQQIVPVGDGLAITLRDVTQAHAREQLLQEQRAALEKSERQLLAITNNVPALIACVDLDLVITFVNDTYQHWYGPDATPPLGRALAAHWGPALSAQRLPYVERALDGERVEFLATSETTSGLRTLQNIYIPDWSGDSVVQGVCLISFDITDFKRTEAELSRLLYQDALTGLDNRLRLNEALPQAMARARRSGKHVGLLFLDVDRFKRINDTHGHAVGDDVLKKIARRLTQVVRETDRVVRLAGDEFVILLEELGSPGEADGVAAKIVEQFKAPLVFDKMSLQVTVSVGVACSDGAMADEGKELLMLADIQLYAAKAAGRNAYASKGA